MMPRPWVRLAVLGTLELAVLAAFGHGSAFHRFPWPGLSVFAASFLLYALAARSVWRPATPEAAAPDHRLQLAVIWGLAVAMRVALLPLTPELSDDVYRYLWDGHVQSSGVNPYVYSPAAPELEGVRTPAHALVNNPTVPTIYPPFAQIVFLLAALAGSSIALLKVVWLACDLGTGWVLARIARESGRSEVRVLLLYLWAPLLLVEVAWSAHLEPLGLLPMTVAIWWTQSAGAGEHGRSEKPPHPYQPFGAGVALALAALTKVAPAAALPALVRRHGRFALAGFAAAGLVLYLPYASAGSALFDGLRTYGEHWWFMKGPFGLVEAAVGDPLRARRTVAVAVVGVTAWTVLRGFDLERALFWILGTGMILTPTLHPWYVLWMLPLAALRGARAWLLLSGLAFIGYFGVGFYLAEGVWTQPPAARAALWIPFLSLLLVDAVRSPVNTPHDPT